jgi:predicted DNA-binding antitoxin AbrB/MazE fold protein
MSHEFDAIYDRGVFRPLEPVELPDQTKVHLQIQDVAERNVAEVLPDPSAQKTAMTELIAWVENRPVDPAAESVSVRDHDQFLYGWQK